MQHLLEQEASDVTSSIPGNELLEKFKEGTQVKLPVWLSGLQRPGVSKTIADYFINAAGALYIGVQTERGLVYLNAENLRLEVMHSVCPSCRCEKPSRVVARRARPVLNNNDEFDDEEED